VACLSAWARVGFIQFIFKLCISAWERFLEWKRVEREASHTAFAWGDDLRSVRQVVPARRGGELFQRKDFAGPGVKASSVHCNFPQTRNRGHVEECFGRRLAKLVLECNGQLLALLAELETNGHGAKLRWHSLEPGGAIQREPGKGSQPQQVQLGGIEFIVNDRQPR